MSEHAVRVRLQDPAGQIASIRAKLNPQCSVRLSPYCDTIISMRLQGTEYRAIEKWLTGQGDQFRIPASTIHRNFAQTKIKPNLTYAEEALEGLGGQAPVDLVKEMSTNIWLQKQRIDRMVRAEEAKQREPGNEGYYNRRLKDEIAAYNDLLKTLHSTLQEGPVRALEAKEAEERLQAGQTVTLTADAKEVLKDLILNNEISLAGGADVIPTSRPKFVN